MTNNEFTSRQLIEKAEGWINPLLEKAVKAETVVDNVDKIRAWVVDGGRESYDAYDALTFRKRIRKISKGQRLNIAFSATEPEDLESHDKLDLALSIGVSLNNIPADYKKTLDLRFRYGDPKTQAPTHEDPSPDLYCHIFAADTETGTILGTEWRKPTDLQQEELELLLDLTTSVVPLIS